MLKGHCSHSTFGGGGHRTNTGTTTRGPNPTPGSGALTSQGYPIVNGEGHLTRYQALLLDSPEVALKVCQTLNPATLLPRREEKELHMTV